MIVHYLRALEIGKVPKSHDPILWQLTSPSQQCVLAVRISSYSPHMTGIHPCVQQVHHDFGLAVCTFGILLSHAQIQWSEGEPIQFLWRQYVDVVLHQLLFLHSE